MGRQHTPPHGFPLSPPRPTAIAAPMPSAREPPPLKASSVGRSAALGLCGGLFLGGLGLLVVGLRGTFGTPDCAGLTGAECDLVRQATREMGRVQALAAGALIALSAALFVLLRPRPPEPTGPTDGEDTAR